MRANGAAIRAFRELRGLSLRQLAHLTGISPQHASRIEHETGNPSDELAARIASVLNVPSRAIDREKETTSDDHR